ncbi:hypothetical protein QA646_08685 [Rhizobium sp. CB3090]|uniref:glycoside hydrolase family protein n=1 Tax=Rhizobium sp. CB3090 TaxID=3039156 RepID=UPI0024B227D3|nr:hypothetical protein [Rhizobium sp. CB3090]WFU10898.1 hypothetical protein QA646_08685 [Rhizobium sp. CB3090]
MNRREILRGLACISFLSSNIKYALSEDQTLASSIDSRLDALSNNPRLIDLLRQVGPSEGVTFLRGILTHGIAGRHRSDRPISERAKKLIVTFEVSNEKHYTASLQKLTWPYGSSGPTLGIGYDIGYVNKKIFDEDWTDYIDKNRIDVISAGCGLTAANGRDFVKKNQQVSISWDEANKQFRDQMSPFLVGETLAALPKNAEQLSPDSLGALCSLVYNRGASFQVADDRHTEMRNIRRLIAQGRFKDVPNEITNMKRIWRGVPNMEGLLIRRDLEAKLFRAGL